MSFINLVFGLGMQRTQIGALTLDALLTEDTRLVSNVTAYPVEDGAPISDHVANENEQLSLSGVVAGAGVTLFSGGGRSKLMAAKDAIRVLHEQRVPITIVTGMDVYTDMVMTNADIGRNNEGEFININCQFEKIRKVTVKTADIPPQKVAGTDKGAGAKGKAGTTEAKGGKVSDKTANATSATDTQRQSKLHGLIHGNTTIEQAVGIK